MVLKLLSEYEFLGIQIENCHKCRKVPSSSSNAKNLESVNDQLSRTIRANPIVLVGEYGGKKVEGMSHVNVTVLNLEILRLHGFELILTNLGVPF